MSISFRKISLICILIYGLAFPSFARNERTSFESAKNLYKHKLFAKSINQFQKLIEEGDKRPVVYLYLAHSFYMMKNRAEAIKTYKFIINSFPGTGEATVASSALRKFGISTSQMPSNSKQKKISSRSLLDSIDIIPPRFGHPRVTQNTVSIVRGVISGLPIRMYRILDEGGARLHIGSNMIDRWPDSLNGRHPANGHLYCNEPGRTYDLDMYIFERPLAREGSRTLGQIWSENVIRTSVYMQCAHALDYLMEHLSSDAEFQKFYNQDLKSIPEDLKAKLLVEAAGTRNGRIQTFGEIVILEMGCNTPKGPLMKRAFPRTRMFVKDSIKRIALKK